MIVTFCGHSKIAHKETIRKRLKDEIHDLLHTGYRTFYLGGYGDFDNLAAAVLGELKETCPDMERLLILPYPDRPADAAQYDGTLYPPLETVPKRFAVSRRNKWIVEQSSVMIACVDHDWGGAAKTLEHAVRRGLRIINIGSITNQSDHTGEQEKMFLYKDEKFHIAGLSFTIPDGYTLDVLDTDESYQNSMKMVSPDGNIIAAVKAVICLEGSIALELDAVGHFHDKLVKHADTFETLLPAAPITRKGLTGYCAAYQTEGWRYHPSRQYYEELYDISRTPNELNFVEICITTTADYTVQRALEDPQIIRFLAELEED